MNEIDLAKITALRHQLHRHPELSGREQGTMARLKAFLRENTSLTVVDRDGWFYAMKEAPSPAEAPIAFRADTDALPIDEGIPLPHGSLCPGIAHKCGHDGHSAALCGLALELDKLTLSRTVYLIFQPAEEIGQGARRCAELLREKSIGEIYAFHNLGGYPEGTVIYRRGLTQPASEGLSITLRGRQSHASAPELGINPAEAASRLVLRARELAAAPHRGMVLCTVTGVRVGTGDFGISAGDGEVRMTLRAEEESELENLESILLQYADALAEETGLTAAHQITDRFPETRNHDFCLDRVIRAAQKLNIPTLAMTKLWRASEDFGYYTKICPGAIFYLGSGESYSPLHTREYDFNDRLLPTAVDLFKVLATE